MTRYFLDTNAILKWIAGDERVPPKTIAILKNGENEFSASAVSAYEIANKTRLGKLVPLPSPLKILLENLRVTTIPVEFSDMIAAGELVWSHRDPWDRIIAIQVMVHNMQLISSDREFDTLNIPRLWS
jgi:PIN domain nuclease of toxin-antitoxin system